MSSQDVDAPVAVTTGLVVLDGCSTGVADVVRLADGTARPVAGTEAMKRVEESWDAARRIAATGRVYGRSTGVGANRNEDVPTEAAAEHGLRLLRSHAGAIGEELPARQVRAMLAALAFEALIAFFFESTFIGADAQRPGPPQHQLAPSGRVFRRVRKMPQHHL
ncbi:aromatic amino acid lyase, partial [Streptomyces phaeochromogenes]|uniref:aromatic amino acid lyase n=1 Tax=Streptomyces phaeochromogenes TaxID=1923 RepID=UPI0033EFB160